MTSVNYAVTWADILRALSQTVVGRFLIALATVWAVSASLVQPLWQEVRAVVIVSLLVCGLALALVFRRTLLSGTSQVLAKRF